MSQVSDSVLKSYFQAGDQPLESQFEDLIDSKLSVSDAVMSTFGLNFKGPGYNAIGDGIADDLIPFLQGDADLVDAGGGTGFVPTGTYRLSGDVTFSELVQIRMDMGAVFTAATPVTVTFTEAPDLPLSKVFGTNITAVFLKAPDTGMLPEWWGATTTADDTPALQKAANAARGGAYNPLLHGGPPYDNDEALCGVNLLSPVYTVTDGIDFWSVRGMHFLGRGKQSTVIQVSGHITNVLNLIGFAFGKVGGFTIRQKTSDVADSVVNVIDWDWTPAQVDGSSYQCVFEDIAIHTLKFVHGIGIGEHSGAYQVDNGMFRDIFISGAFVPNSGVTDFYQAAFWVGSGTAANILNHHFENCHPLLVRRGYYINNVNEVSIKDGDGTTLDDFVYKLGSGVLNIDNVRVEETCRLLDSLGGASFSSSALLENVVWAGGRATDDVYIRWNYPGVLTCRNFYVYPNANGVQKITCSVATLPVVVILEAYASEHAGNFEEDIVGVGADPATIIHVHALGFSGITAGAVTGVRQQRLFTLSTGGTGTELHLGSNVLDSGNSYVVFDAPAAGSARGAQWALAGVNKWLQYMSGTAVTWFIRDVVNARMHVTLTPGASDAAALSLFNSKVLAAGGIGVGNSAAATTPGSVTKKIEIFDAAGASLGFIAVYGSIT